MRTTIKLLGASIWVLFMCMAGSALADHHDRNQEKGHDNHQESRQGKEHEKKPNTAISPIDPDYVNACGGCHFAYQPFLLPSASWTKILDNLDDHFGESVELSSEDIKAIRNYLDSNAADHSQSQISRKIMKSLAGPVLRVTEVPYIVRKHKDDDIPADAFKRKSVGSMSNCAACHTSAAQGNYDEDLVSIPK